MKQLLPTIILFLITDPLPINVLDPIFVDPFTRHPVEICELSPIFTSCSISALLFIYSFTNIHI